MNLLAHALIAWCTLPNHDGQEVTGSVMADFFAGQTLENYPSAVVSGIRQHREVDSFTDRHLAFVTLCARLDRDGAPRLMAGILLDLFWDWVLGSNWPEFGEIHCGLGLDEFCGRVNQQLRATAAYHSPRFRQVTPWLIGDNWLAAYATKAGIAATLRGLASRVSSGAELAGCERFLDSHKGELIAGFRQFWPELWQAFTPE